MGCIVKSESSIPDGLISKQAKGAFGRRVDKALSLKIVKLSLNHLFTVLMAPDVLYRGQPNKHRKQSIGDGSLNSRNNP